MPALRGQISQFHLKRTLEAVAEVIHGERDEVVSRDAIQRFTFGLPCQLSPTSTHEFRALLVQAASLAASWAASLGASRFLVNTPRNSTIYRAGPRSSCSYGDYCFCAAIRRTSRGALLAERPAALLTSRLALPALLGAEVKKGMGHNGDVSSETTALHRCLQS